MNKLLLSLLLLLTVSQRSIAANFKLDESHTSLSFKIKHLGISNVRGHFNKFSGHADFNEKTNKLSKMVVSIVASSINTNEPDRDKHLRSKDFFDVTKFKELKFVSTKVTYKHKLPNKIIGKLTMHGITRKVTLEVDEWGGTAIDPWKNKRLAFSARAKIDRRKFGLTWNKGLAQLAGVMVGNDVKLIIEVEAIKVD